MYRYMHTYVLDSTIIHLETHSEWGGYHWQQMVFASSLALQIQRFYVFSLFDASSQLLGQTAHTITHKWASEQHSGIACAVCASVCQCVCVARWLHTCQVCAWIISYMSQVHGHVPGVKCSLEASSAATFSSISRLILSFCSPCSFISSNWRSSSNWSWAVCSSSSYRWRIVCFCSAGDCEKTGWRTLL